MRKLILLFLLAAPLLAGCSYSKGPDHYTAQLLRDLKSPDEEQRRGAAVQMGFLQDMAKQKKYAMPALAKLVEDKDPILANNAHQSLQRLTGDETVPQEQKAWEGYVKRLVTSLDKEGKPDAELLKKEKAKLANEEGVLAMASGDYLGAEQRFLSALGLCPDNGDYHSNLAKNYLNMRRYDEALRYAMRAIAINPDLDVAYMHEADAYAGLGKNYEATNAYLEAIKRDKSNSNWAAHLSLAKLYMKQGMLDDAQTQIDAGISINPRQPNLHVQAALIRYGRQEYFKSWQEVEKVRELGYDWEDKGFLTKLKAELRKMGMTFPDEEDTKKPLPALNTGDFDATKKTTPRKPAPEPEQAQPNED